MVGVRPTLWASNTFARLDRKTIHCRLLRNSRTFQELEPQRHNDASRKRSRDSIELTHSDHLEGDGLRIVTSMVDELGRLQGQRGLFTWLDSEKYFELQGFLDNTGRSNLLTKIILSEKGVLDGLSDLRKHGIDHRLLFPDLTGAALAANATGNIYF